MARRRANLDSGRPARFGASPVLGVATYEAEAPPVGSRSSQRAGSPPDRLPSEPLAPEELAAEMFERLRDELAHRVDDVSVAAPERHREAIRSRLRGAGLLN